jgi:hypothetical protein
MLRQTAQQHQHSRGPVLRESPDEKGVDQDGHDKGLEDGSSGGRSTAPPPRRGTSRVVRPAVGAVDPISNQTATSLNTLINGRFPPIMASPRTRTLSSSRLLWLTLRNSLPNSTYTAWSCTRIPRNDSRSATVPNAFAALLLDIKDITNRQPHIYLEWTEGPPLPIFLRFLFLDVGEVTPRHPRSPATRREPDRSRRPRVHGA